MTTHNASHDSLDFLASLTKEPLSIANLIRTIRACEGESQTSFASKLGLTRQRLCDIEHQRSQISPKLAAEFANKLGYSETQFIRLALQDILNRDKLHYYVNLEEAA